MGLAIVIANCADETEQVDNGTIDITGQITWTSGMQSSQRQHQQQSMNVHVEIPPMHVHWFAGRLQDSPGSIDFTDLSIVPSTSTSSSETTITKNDDNNNDGVVWMYDQQIVETQNTAPTGDGDDGDNNNDNDMNDNYMMFPDATKTIIDVAVFRQQGSCVLSDNICDCTELGLGWKNSNHTKQWCCDIESIENNKCQTLRRLIVDPLIFDGEHCSIIFDHNNINNDKNDKNHQTMTR